MSAVPEVVEAKFRQDILLPLHTRGVLGEEELARRLGLEPADVERGCRRLVELGWIRPVAGYEITGAGSQPGQGVGLPLGPRFVTLSAFPQVDGPGSCPQTVDGGPPTCHHGGVMESRTETGRWGMTTRARLIGSDGSVRSYSSRSAAMRAARRLAGPAGEPIEVYGGDGRVRDIGWQESHIHVAEPTRWIVEED